TVYAMAPATPMGANIITMLVNLNMVSERPSQKARIGRRFSWAINASAMPKIMLDTTTCNTWPSATDLAIFSGNIWRTTSVHFWAGAPETVAVAAFGGGVSPTPAWEIWIAPRPINSAKVVTISKYKSA